MGLLDDAIREHLELKRRHGADPQEVARQEDEALGPIGGHEADADTDADAELDEPPVPYEEPAAPVHEHQQELELPHVAEEPSEEPAHELHERDVHQPTVEYSVEDEQAAEVPPAEPRQPPEPTEPEEPADELEETPEFLQETPEHDRLWFEQKPPRDFDF